MQGLERVQGQQTATVMNVSLRRGPGGLGERGQLGCRDVGASFLVEVPAGARRFPPWRHLCRQRGDAGQ